MIDEQRYKRGWGSLGYRVEASRSVRAIGVLRSRFANRHSAAALDQCQPA
jgi:hypothetical protein